MPRVLLKFWVFTLGVFLAFSLAFALQYFTGSSTESSTPRARLLSPPPVTEPVAETDPTPTADSSNPLFDAAPQDRPELVARALESGTMSDLQLLKSDQLRQLPDYRNGIVPTMKRAGIGGLLSRFVESDWLDWPRANSSVQGGPSAARAYIDDIRVVNPELARYLETAALLFQALYLKTSQGLPFTLREELYAISRSAERLLEYRKAKAIPARQLLDLEIGQDSLFVRELERKRADFVLLYTKEHPDEIQKNFTLLLGLEPSYAGDEVLRSLTNILRRFALEGSPKFRDQILREAAESSAMQELLKRDLRIRKAVAELYLIGVIDALEQADTRRAMLYLNESVSVQPGLRSQELLAQAIRRRAADTAEAIPEPVKENPEAKQKQAKRLELFADEADELPATDGGGTSYLMLFLLVGFVIIISVFVILYRRSSRLTSLQLYEAGPKAPATMSMTSPTAVNFETEEPAVVNRPR